MPSIHLFHTPPSETIKSQVQQMVIDDLSEISQVAIAPSNPLYQLYQYGVGYEVHLYFEAMDGTRNMPVELIVALDDQAPETVLGFVLYQPTLDDPQACSVAYLAVRPTYRRQGIARSLLQTLMARYPHVELASSVGKVPYFEAMGFQVLAARGPQVLMNTRDYRTAGLLPVLDVAPIYRSLEVRQIHAYLLQQHGKKAMTEAEKKRDRHLDQLTHRARVLVQERLGG
ncbi:GNAT family N-acetyltransferase [Pseudomonas sp. SDI]|uniref:GNAT family N-acetyltransferase n=1 Tax=Pseudomonas sp. SDI TaxID=2170734 RepID=UPI000DE5F3AA|nr:GNAT family N-acetyltransferase [Pseudomonas sp. SDI]PWB33145.1 GNAT family N-acetyltransferase [Pseudomonas sp. SDI]